MRGHFIVFADFSYFHHFSPSSVCSHGMDPLFAIKLHSSLVVFMFLCFMFLNFLEILQYSSTPSSSPLIFYVSPLVTIIKYFVCDPGVFEGCLPKSTVAVSVTTLFNCMTMNSSSAALSTYTCIFIIFITVYQLIFRSEEVKRTKLSTPP